MKIPGRLWLQFEVDPQQHSTHVRQTTIFDAAGWVGLAYWYTLYPLDRRVFTGMLRASRCAGARSQDLAAVAAGAQEIVRAASAQMRTRVDIYRLMRPAARLTRFRFLSLEENCSRSPESSAMQSRRAAQRDLERVTAARSRGIRWQSITDHRRELRLRLSRAVYEITRTTLTRTSHPS
jgi:hypothetical protein